MQSKAEAACYGRQTELARQDAELEARRANLDRREAELLAMANVLGLREVEVRRTATALSDREAAVQELEVKRKALGAEVADLGRLASELRPVVECLQVRRDEDEAADRGPLDLLPAPMPSIALMTCTLFIETAEGTCGSVRPIWARVVTMASPLTGCMRIT